jgi:hypothetical protein
MGLNSPTMRYFLYISDSKVDMLLPQIPTALKTSVSAELGFDLKILSGKLSNSRDVLNDRVSRLLAVERYILKKERVGTAAEPASWIRGQGHALMSEIREDARVIFFFLRTGGAYLALGGSMGHLVGCNPEKRTSLGYSFVPHLLEYLRQIDSIPSVFNRSDEELAEYASLGVESVDSHPWTPTVYYACRRRQARSFTLPISFLARRIVAERYMDTQVILATPLYIAEAENV